MYTILGLSIFWVVYGIAGLLGHQAISSDFKGHSWTKEYIRCRGISWLLLGIPWVIVNLVCIYFVQVEASSMVPILIACALPSLGYSYYTDSKYKKYLELGL